MKKTLAVMLAILSLATVAPPAAKASAPSGTIMKIGLSYDSSVLPSGNLQNVSGAGSGFEFGYFDGNGKFVSIGAKYEDTSITVLMDRNMSWHPGAGGGYGEYRENLDGTAIIGCFHIQLTGGYETFGAAKATADEYADSFIKYASGAFFVCVGHYLTRADAESAIASKGWVRCAVEAGTSNTVTVAKTGTSTIIFEYDGGGSRPLGVMPVSAGGEKCETWFRGNRYRGGFQYNRRSGDKLTVINFISIEEYIKGVVPYEMSNTWPMEALKAQACCARTFAESTRNRHGSSGFDLCPNEHCQAYRGRGNANARSDSAVDDTAGVYITYQGKLCSTFYSSSDGGATENCENVWSEAIPYCRGVIDPYEADVASMIPRYEWTVTYTPAELTQRLRNRGYNCATIVSLHVSKYTLTGNVYSVVATDENGATFTFSKREQLLSALGVTSIRFNIGNAVATGGGIYANSSTQTLDKGGTYYVVGGDGEVTEIEGPMYAISSNSQVDIVTGEGGVGSGNGMIGGVFTIRGKGRGHSVGMSQWGAYSMAQNHGKTYVEIIKFYFTGVDVG